MGPKPSPRPTRLPRRPAALIGLATLAVVATGCVSGSATLQAREVAWLYGVFLASAAVVFAIVVGLLAWSVLRYRGAPGREVVHSPESHGSLALEIGWWAAPSILVAVLAFLTIGVLGQIDARADAPEVTVRVEGFQWGWRFTYQDEGVTVTSTANDPRSITLPVDQPIALIISSRDVVHSFSVPEFLVKRDAVPGRENRIDVVIDEEGSYGGQCGEFCGLLHARQIFQIDAVSPESFDAWLAANAAGQP